MTTAGIKVPDDYAKPIPQGYEIINLPPYKMLCFQGMLFEKEEDFSEAIGIVFEAITNCNSDFYGYRFIWKRVMNT